MCAGVLTLLLVVGSGCGDGRDSRARRCPWRDFWGPEPQTCYAPRFGCYPGNNRFMHRYPAFHGTYYRQAYNYRTLFDYPWHASLHEPTSLFSYGASAETVDEYHHRSAAPESTVEEVPPTEYLPPSEPAAPGDARLEPRPNRRAAAHSRDASPARGERLAANRQISRDLTASSPSSAPGTARRLEAGAPVLGRREPPAR